MYESITRYIDVFVNWKSAEQPGCVIGEFLCDLERLADHHYADTLQRFGLE